ncbi:MAG: GNAT family N-acetyltransferase, partial [Anaerotignum sp.]|nr:GNAT family N-acetyltransferase [Anaerotignum sp.]
MIKTEKIPDGKQWAEEIAGYISQGMRTNFYGSAEAFIPQLEQVSKLDFEGGCYIFHEKDKQTDLYFFLEKERMPVNLPETDKVVVLEQVAAAKNPPAMEEWEAVGFEKYLQRKRLFLSAKKTEEEQRAVSFAKTEEAEQIFSMMEDAFEPYTSALPDFDTLKQDISENRVIAVREGEELLGFLRFGREKKVSVLWQIVVSTAGRGKGIGTSL